MPTIARAPQQMSVGRREFPRRSVATLHRKTPHGNGTGSASRDPPSAPKIGAATMYTSMKAVVSRPTWLSDSPSGGAFRSGTMPEDDVTIEVIQQVDEREHAQGNHRRARRRGRSLHLSYHRRGRSGAPAGRAVARNPAPRRIQLQTARDIASRYRGNPSLLVTVGATSQYENEIPPGCPTYFPARDSCSPGTTG